MTDVDKTSVQRVYGKSMEGQNSVKFMAMN